MAQARTFYPSRRFGFLFHTVCMSLLLMAGAYGMWRVARVETAAALLISLAPAAAAALGVPLLAYRLYGLLGAEYTVERDGIRLRWGLRLEHIPADQVEWVGRSDRYGQALPKPWLVWPGSTLGVRHLPDGRRLEYLSGRTRNLVLIVTPGRLYAISPADPGDFELTFLRLTELGSLAPIPARSVMPAFLFGGFRSDRAARLMLLGSLLLWLVLLASVAFGIADREQVVLRFTAQGEAAEFAPAVRLFLLPVLSALFLLVDGLLGLIFYRRVELRPLAYLLWGAGIVTTGLLLVAVLMILNVA
jgi:hypothetical protein